MDRTFLIERWSAPCLLLGGVLLVGSVLLKAVALVEPSVVPRLAIAFVAIPGHLAAFVGVLGLYPRLVAEGRTLARAGGWLVGVAAAWLVGLLGWALFGQAFVAAIGPVVPASPPDSVFVGFALVLAVAFGLYGIASLRTTTISRRTGSLIAAFSGTWLAIFGLSVAPTVAEWQWIVIYALQPPVLLALGWTLQSGTRPTRPMSDVPDVSMAD